MNKQYVVEMLRWGDDHNHSYVVGVCDSLHDAYELGMKHEYYRGGKYTCRITEHPQVDEHFIDHCDTFFEDTMSESEFALELMTRVNQHLGEYDG